MVFSNHSIIKTFSKYLIASIVKEKLNAILKGLNLPMMGYTLLKYNCIKNTEHGADFFLVFLSSTIHMPA